MVSAEYRWRKTTDVNRENAIFELVVGEIPILDIGFTDRHVLEVAFNPSIAGKLMALSELQLLLSEGQALAEADL